MTQGALRLEIERHPAVNHIFLHRCATSPFSREDYRIFGENYFPLACLSPIHLERLVRRAPSPSERHALEELRSRDEDARALYERFLCAAKSSVPDALTARVPGPAYRFTRKVQRILAEEPFEVALGAVVPIFAWAVPRMFASLLAGLTRAGFSEEELRYFTREEPKGEVFSAALSAAQIRRGALLCLEAYGELWTGVQRAVVRYRQPRAARPDGARPRSALHEILLTAWDGLRAARLLEQKIIERQSGPDPRWPSCSPLDPCHGGNVDITFVSTRKNLDRTERELYEMDLLIKVLGFSRSFLDLGIETVAACTPKGVRFRIVDEYLEEIDYGIETSLVALSAKTSCATKAYDVARRFREKGKKVVLGGIHASLRPEEALEHVDCVVTGEAELVWPEAVRDLLAGKLKQRYDARDFPPMTAIPTPAWTPQRASQYLFHQLQTTRGCPFKCRFCSVPDIAGQEFRSKSIDQVVRELRALPKAKGPIASAKPLYIVDDNFISRTRYTKELLRAMVPLAQRGEIPSWSAETTLNVASDEELLDLFRDAGCATLIIGFESVTEATLNDMDKPVNFCLTYQEAVDRIHRRGLTVVGNFIVGFDTDTLSVFKQTRDFIQKTGLLYPFFSILTPMPGTGLFDEMKAKGRLDHERWELYDTRHVVFSPKNMRRDELMDGYVWLYEQCYGTHLLYDRLESEWRRRPKSGGLPEKLFVAARLAPDIARGDREKRDHFGRGIKLMMSRHLKSDAGQLLYVLDSYDFALFMRRYSTSRRAENYQTFEAPERAMQHRDEELSVLQWQNKKAVARTKKALPIVP